MSKKCKTEEIAKYIVHSIYDYQRFFCIVPMTLTNFGETLDHDNFLDRIYIKTYFPHDCQREYSISVIKEYTKVTYGDVFEQEM